MMIQEGQPFDTFSDSLAKDFFPLGPSISYVHT